MTVGAQKPTVDESLEKRLFQPQVLVKMEFQEIAEPRALSPCDLQQLVKSYRTFTKVAKVIGASEAFVRLNAQRKRKGKDYGKYE